MPAFKHGHIFRVNQHALRVTEENFKKLPRNKSVAVMIKPDKKRTPREKEYAKVLNMIRDSRKHVSQTLDYARRVSKEKQRQSLTAHQITPREGHLHKPNARRFDDDDDVVEAVGTNVDHAYYVSHGTDGYGQYLDPVLKRKDPMRIGPTEQDMLKVHFPDKTEYRAYVSTQTGTHYIKESMDASRRPIRDYFRRGEDRLLTMRTRRA